MKKMNAVVCSKYGPPEILQFEEIETPTPNDNQVLVKVHAASVNAYYWHFAGRQTILNPLDGRWVTETQKSCARLHRDLPLVLLPLFSLAR